VFIIMDVMLEAIEEEKGALWATKFGTAL
jgi:hypothetical protein